MQRRLRAVVQILASLLFSIQAPAQITVALDDSATYPAARIGLNQGNQDYYESYLLKNLTGINPGFEGQIKDVVQNVAQDGTPLSFTANNQWDQVPADFFAGGTFFVAYGANRGCSGAIASNTKAGKANQGTAFTLANACPHSFRRGDVVFTRLDQFPTKDENVTFDRFGWGRTISAGGQVRVDGNPGDQPPGSSGRQCLKLDTSASPSATAEVHTAFDTGSQLGYAFNGDYTQTIKARVVNGSGLRLTLSGLRLNGAATGHNTGVNWSQTVELTPSWKTYSVTFSGRETPSTAPGSVQISIALSGQGVVLIDDSSLTSNRDTNPSAFRDQIVKLEKLWNPGEERYWAGQNAESLSNWIRPQFGREGTVGGASIGPYAQSPQIQYGLHDWLVKEAYEGVPQVWIEMPITWRYTEDAADMVDYIAGGADTRFGTKRIALGQKVPWSSVFHRIILEYGNEVWNPSAAGENMPMYSAGGKAYWSYLPMAVDFCTAMKADRNWNRSTMKCAAGLQSGGDFWGGQLKLQDPAHAVDMQADNEYGQYSIKNANGADPWTSAWTETWAAVYDRSNGFYKTWGAGGYPSGVYEYNNSTSSGSDISQAQANGYPEGEGYGLVDILMPLFTQKAFGIVDNDFFTLSQKQQSIRNASNQEVLLREWGAVAGLGGRSENVRPMFLAISMVNGCIGDGMGYSTRVTGAPSYDFSGYNSVGPEKNVPYLNVFAFKSRNERCIVAVNTDPARPLRFSFTGKNPPSGAVTSTLYSSPNLTDNNEAAEVVRLKTSDLKNPSSFEIPPHSAMTLRYTIGSTAAASKDEASHGRAAIPRRQNGGGLF